MKNLPLNALRAFAAVYESGGIRPAARHLRISHSSVSRHMRELEEWLDTPLLHHDGGRRSLEFTAPGEKLGREALKHLRGLSHCLSAVREMKSGNTVTVATTPSVATRWLLPRLAQFQEGHPAIEVSVIAEQKMEAPDGNRVDFNIRMGQGPWPGLDCKPLMDDSLFPVVGRKYWQDNGPEMDLAALKLLHDRDPQAGWQLWRQAHGPELPNLGKGPRYASSDLVLRAAAQNLGVALARGRLAEEDLASGALIRPFGDASVPLHNAYWIVRPENATARSAVEILIGWLGQNLAMPPTGSPS